MPVDSDWLPKLIKTTNVMDKYINKVNKIAKILTLGIFFDGFFKSTLKYARFWVIDVKNMNKSANICMTPRKLIVE